MSNQEHNSSAPAAAGEPEAWVDDTSEPVDETPVAAEHPRKTQAPAIRSARRRIERYWEERALRAQIVDDVDAA